MLNKPFRYLDLFIVIQFGIHLLDQWNLVVGSDRRFLGQGINLFQRAHDNRFKGIVQWLVSLPA